MWADYTGVSRNVRVRGNALSGRRLEAVQAVHGGGQFTAGGLWQNPHDLIKDRGQLLGFFLAESAEHEAGYLPAVAWMANAQS